MKKATVSTMARTTSRLVLITLAGILAVPLVAGWAWLDESGEARQTEQTAPSGKYASVNGLNMYYEIHGGQDGHGEPLVLLHGAFGTVELWGEILSTLAQTRQVIAIEQQAHGHTADIDRPLSYEQMGADTAALLQQLNIKNADFFGYSMGGDVALQVAIQHPDLVRKLVFLSSAYDKEGWHPEIMQNIDAMKPEDLGLAGTPLYDAYHQVAPNPADWPTLVDKVKQLEREFVGWSPEEVRSIEAPTLIILGDSDAVRLEHAVQMFTLLGGGVAGDLTALPRSRLAVLPATNHVGVVMERAPTLLAMVTEFLDAPIPTAE